MNSINHCISLQQREQNLLIPFATFHIENNSQIVSTCNCCGSWSCVPGSPSRFLLPESGEAGSWRPDGPFPLHQRGWPARSIVDYFKGNAVYINVMKNISVDCDCDGNASAPCMQDIGILASFDPVAVDQACLDLVYNSNDSGRDKLIERIESRHGVHTIEAAYDLGVGNREYELIDLDK